MKKIVVVGSLNMDSVIEVANMPKKGGDDFRDIKCR